MLTEGLNIPAGSPQAAQFITRLGIIMGREGLLQDARAKKMTFAQFKSQRLDRADAAEARRSAADTLRKRFRR